EELNSKVWKEPGFFLLPPSAVAAFGRECTRRGVPPPTVSLFGAQFLTWRGVPLIPSDKVPVENGTSKILLLRTGLSVRFMGINHQAIASYLVSLYCSLAVLVDDALAVLDDVAIDRYHEYKWPSLVLKTASLDFRPVHPRLATSPRQPAGSSNSRRSRALATSMMSRVKISFSNSPISSLRRLPYRR